MSSNAEVLAAADAVERKISESSSLLAWSLHRDITVLVQFARTQLTPRAGDPAADKIFSQPEH